MVIIFNSVLTNYGWLNCSKRAHRSDLLGPSLARGGRVKEWSGEIASCGGIYLGAEVVASADGEGKNTHQVTYLDCQRELAHTAANVCRICLDARALCGPLLI